MQTVIPREAGDETVDADPIAGAQERPLTRSVARAYEYIRVRILDGRFPPSSHLVEHILAREIEVSRTPIREALRRLAADGFVSFIPNQGARVVEWSDQSLADLIDVRCTLASMATLLATPRLEAAELDRLRALKSELARVAANDLPQSLLEAARLNNAFHRVIFAACGNAWLVQLLDQTAYLPMIHRAHFVFDSEAWQHGIARYKDLIDAFEARDGEWAASLIRSHFLAAKHRIRRGSAVGDSSKSILSGAKVR